MRWRNEKVRKETKKRTSDESDESDRRTSEKANKIRIDSRSHARSGLRPEEYLNVENVEERRGQVK